MKIRLKLLVALTALITCGYSSAALAQTCSAADKTNFKTCVDNSLETCRGGFVACNDYEPVLSIKDVSNIAITNCCDIRNRGKRTSCLAKEKMKYTPKTSSGPQKAFFREARRAINVVKNNVCKSTTYSLPAQSSLF